jgi:hypothetical protein
MSSSNAGRHHEKVKIWFIPTLVAAAVFKKKRKKEKLTRKRWSLRAFVECALQSRPAHPDR